MRRCVRADIRWNELLDIYFLGGISENFGSAESMLSQAGARLMKISACGLYCDGSFNEPARTAINPGIASGLPNNWEPQLGQNPRRAR